MRADGSGGQRRGVGGAAGGSRGVMEPMESGMVPTMAEERGWSPGSSPSF